MDNSNLSSSIDNPSSSARSSISYSQTHHPSQYDVYKRRQPSYNDGLLQSQSQSTNQSYTSWNKQNSSLTTPKSNNDIWSLNLANPSSSATTTTTTTNNNIGNNINPMNLNTMGYDTTSFVSVPNCVSAPVTNDNIYKKMAYSSGISNVEMDPLAYQMMQLSTDATQLSASNAINASYFTQQQQQQQQTQSMNQNSVNDHNKAQSNYNKWAVAAAAVVSSNTHSNNINNNGHSNNSNNSNNNNNNNNGNNNNNNNNHNYSYQQSNNSTQNQGQIQGQMQFQPPNSSNYEPNDISLIKISKESRNNNSDDSNSNNNNVSSQISDSEIENFKMKIQLKDIIISKLELEVEKQKEFAKAVSSSSIDSNGNFEIPKNQEQLYNKLVEKIQVTEKELEDTKNRLESLVTAIALNPNQSAYKNGRYEEEEIAHKIISKMQMLSEENEELSKMLSYGKSKEKDIEIGLLRRQNNELREKVSKLESKLNDRKI